MNTARDFVVVDVETSGFDPADAHIELATVTAGGAIENSIYRLLDPGVDPGPTDVHGLTPAMMAGQPRYADIPQLMLLLRDPQPGRPQRRLRLRVPGRRSPPLRRRSARHGGPVHIRTRRPARP